MSWRPGDRIRVCLPDKSLRRYRWIKGTVEAVDLPGLTPGVKVKLDESVNGVDNCYATHAELESEDQ